MFGKNTVAETSFRDEERKRSLRQENWLFIYKKKNGKIIVSVTVNSVAPLQKKHVSVTDIWGNEIKN